MPAYIAPFLGNSFNCPHCGALAHQSWFQAHVLAYKVDEFPFWNVKDDIDKEINSSRSIEEDQKAGWIDYFKQARSREPFFPSGRDGAHAGRLQNADFTRCFSCKKFAAWIGCKMVYPGFTHEVMPAEDMPSDIRVDFIEAQGILSKSPRGSAALLRLCVQKLCKHLGEEDKNIHRDIGELVRKGLDVRIQQALDIVRVVGNDAVHPGQIDLRDDLETANKLFTLVNLILDALITQPRMISGLFDNIPESKREEITRRDAKA